jgi:BirA family biotin operon repressor/biotin-[acetyl-CoA-carboxylase] ligase
LLADLSAIEGDWLVALAQDSGRGRHGRAWETISGNFFGSTIVQLRASDPPAPALALAAGLALIEAVETVAPNAALTLKWPNDLMLGDAKLAGILLERSGDRVVAGFGVNLAGAPSISGRRTTSLGSIASIDSKTFAPMIARSFASVLAAWRNADPIAFSSAWMTRAHPLGTALDVHSGPGERISGAFDGIEPDGAMRLRLGDGRIEIVRAGDVSLA